MIRVAGGFIPVSHLRKKLKDLPSNRPGDHHSEGRGQQLMTLGLRERVFVEAKCAYLATRLCPGFGLLSSHFSIEDNQRTISYRTKISREGIEQ